MEEIEMRKRPGRPRKYEDGTHRTIYVNKQEYEEISTEAEKQGMSFFEFMAILYHAYAKDDNREIIEQAKELKETREEMGKLKRENEELSDKLAKIYLSSKKSAEIDIEKEDLILEAQIKFDDLLKKFRDMIKRAQNGFSNKELVKNNRELFIKWKKEYQAQKEKLEAKKINLNLSEIEEAINEAKKALGITILDGKDRDIAFIYSYIQENEGYQKDAGNELKPELNKSQAQKEQKDSVKVRA